MFIKHVKHYHQWLPTAIPLKAKLGQISSDSVRIQDPSKRPSSGHLYPVSPVKEHYRKGGKCKISRVLQSPVPSTQASPKVEASNRLKQAQHFSTCRKVQNGNSRVHQDLPGSRGMGIVDRPIGHLPSHPHPPKLKEIPLYVSPISDPKAWDIDALNINWAGLTAYAYPPTALLHRVIQKIRQCHCLVIVIAPGWPGMPWFGT